MSIAEVKGEWQGQPVRVVVDDFGDCTAYVGGAGRGVAKNVEIGLVNPFAFRLLMEGLGQALAAEPDDRLLRVPETRQWTKGGKPTEEPAPALRDQQEPTT